MIGRTVPLLGACRWLFITANFFFFATVPAVAKDSVPDWVRTAAAQSLPHYSPETNAVFLMDETTYSVAPDGTATEHYRSALKILRPQGREDAVIAVPFDKDTKILSLHVWSIGPDGHEYALKDNEMVEYGYPGQGSLYSDEKVKVAKAPGRDPGGIVAYEYEQRIRPSRWSYRRATLTEPSGRIMTR
jgi:Domain of Unknown Function with PDB structure (DUF3857)